jgi:hypothetical protein
MHNSVGAAVGVYTVLRDECIALTAFGIYICMAKGVAIWWRDSEIYHIGKGTMLLCEDVGLELRCSAKIIEVNYVG